MVPHQTITLRTIVESEGNGQALIAPEIQAMIAVVLAHPECTNRGLEWVAAFDNCDLLDWFAAAANLKNTVPARLGMSRWNDGADLAGWLRRAGETALHPGEERR